MTYETHEVLFTDDDATIRRKVLARFEGDARVKMERTLENPKYLDAIRQRARHTGRYRIVAPTGEALLPPEILALGEELKNRSTLDRKKAEALLTSARAVDELRETSADRADAPPPSSSRTRAEAYADDPRKYVAEKLAAAPVPPSGRRTTDKMPTLEHVAAPVPAPAAQPPPETPSPWEKEAQSERPIAKELLPSSTSPTRARADAADEAPLVVPKNDRRKGVWVAIALLCLGVLIWLLWPGKKLPPPSTASTATSLALSPSNASTASPPSSAQTAPIAPGVSSSTAQAPSTQEAPAPPPTNANPSGKPAKQPVTPAPPPPVTAAPVAPEPRPTVKPVAPPPTPPTPTSDRPVD